MAEVARGDRLKGYNAGLDHLSRKIRLVTVNIVALVREADRRLQSRYFKRTQPSRDSRPFDGVGRNGQFGSTLGNTRELKGYGIGRSLLGHRTLEMGQRGRIDNSPRNPRQQAWLSRWTCKHFWMKL